MNSTDNAICTAALFNKVAPDWYHYIIYYPIAAFGLMVNIFLFIMYKKYSRAILGKRETFEVAMRMQTFTDISVSLAMFLDESVLLNYGRINTDTKQVFIGFRNVVVLCQSIMINILALDRFLAAFSPMSVKWRRNTVIKMYIIPTTCFIIPIEIIIRFLIITTYLNCPEKVILKRVTTLYYACFLLSCILTNILMYMLLTIIFTFYMRKGARSEMKKRMKSVIKLAAISCQTSFLYIVSLSPSLVGSFIGGFPVNLTIAQLGYIPSLTNGVFFILNNRILRNKILCRTNSVQFEGSVSTV